MSELSPEAEQKVLKLKEAYTRTFPDKIQQLEVCWQNIQFSQFAENELKVMRSACHKLAGSSGSYEFLKLSRAAHDVEQLCFNEEQNISTEATILEIETAYLALINLLKLQG